MPPNDGLLACSCSCGGGGLGVEYRERIDCLRSGRDWPVDPKVLPVAVDGRLVGGCGVPKKSNPSNASAGFVCGLGAGGCCLGGARIFVASVVLGLAGGVGVSSPKRSRVC